MRIRIANRAFFCAAIVAASYAPAHVHADPLDLLVGTWDVRVKTLKPEASVVTYSERYEWILGRSFIRGESSDKSDGTEDVVMATYDRQVDGYPFWIFSSNANYVYLAPATWDADSQTLLWENPANSDIYYRTTVVFSDGSRSWNVLVKDWKGSVLLQQEGQATRRKD